MKISRLIPSTLLIVFTTSSIIAQDGKQIFDQSCAACHQLSTTKTVGPGLLNIGDKRDKEWLKKWIKNSQELIQSGDPAAVQVFKENNEMMMPPFTQLSDGDVEAILTYLGVGQNATANSVAVPESKPVVFTDKDRAMGEQLFIGQKKFSNGGAACISCHNVDYKNIKGGSLAKNLTDAHTRLGTAGITGIVSNPPFPAMTSTYVNSKLTDQEVLELTAFLDKVAQNATDNGTAKIVNNNGFLLQYGMAGSIIIICLIFLLWSNRKKESVKASIYKRQIIRK